MAETDAERERRQASEAATLWDADPALAEIERNARRIAEAWRHGDPTRGTPRQREALARAGEQAEQALQALTLLPEARAHGDVHRVQHLAYGLGVYSRDMGELLSVVEQIESKPQRARSPSARNQERDEKIRAWGLLKQIERQSPLPLGDLATRAKDHFKQLQLSQHQLERILAPIFD
jgi:hypothetical protein